MNKYVINSKRYYLSNYIKTFNFEQELISAIYNGYEKHSNTILHEIVLSQNIKDLCQCIKENKFDINTQNLVGQTPLHYAVINKDIKAIKLLLLYGAKTNIQDYNGNTVLHLAVIYNYSAIVKLVINEKNVNIFNYHGKTPFNLVDDINYASLSLIRAYGGINPRLETKLVHNLTRELLYNFQIAKSHLSSPKTLSIIFSLMAANINATVLHYDFGLIHYLRLLKIKSEETKQITKLNAFIYNDKGHAFNLYVELTATSSNFLIFDSMGYFWMENFFKELNENIKKIFPNAKFFINTNRTQYSFHGCAIITFNIAKKIHSLIEKNICPLEKIPNKNTASTNEIFYKSSYINEFIEAEKFNQSLKKHKTKQKYLSYHHGGIETGNIPDAIPFNNIITIKRKKLGERLSNFLRDCDLQSDDNCKKFNNITGASLLFKYNNTLNNDFYNTCINLKTTKLSKDTVELKIEKSLADEFSINKFFENIVEIPDKYSSYMGEYIVKDTIEKINAFLDYIKTYLISPKCAFITSKSTKLTIWQANFCFNLLTNILVAQNITTKPIMC